MLQRRTFSRLLHRAPLSAVLFDWDGTLLDSFHADSYAYLKMFRAMGIAWGMEELRRYYSPNWHYLYVRAGLPRERWEEADRIWRESYAETRPALMPGARGVLNHLARRYLLGLVTSGSRDRVRRQLRQFGMNHLFSARVFAESTRMRKPHPAPILLALRMLRLPAPACAYVGDSGEDVRMAHRAGVPAIGILGSFPTHERIRAARPEVTLTSIRALPRVIAAWTDCQT